MTEIEIHWPGVNGPSERDEEGDSTLAQWMEDPFKRKVLYVLHLLFESTRYMMIAMSTAAITIIVYGLYPSVLELVGSTIWLVVAAASLVLSLDLIAARYYKSFIDSVSSTLVYTAAMAATFIYAAIKQRTVHPSRISSMMSASLLEKILLTGLSRKHEDKRRFLF